MIEQFENLLDEYLKSKIAEKSAKYNKKVLDALIKEGFMREEAIQIIVHGQNNAR